MIRIGVIGLGYWGPNLVRCFNDFPECQVAYICDRDTNRLRSVCERFPEAIGTTEDSDVLLRDRVDAVVIATPIKTHYPLATRALEQGIHTFVEKPLATSQRDCIDLIEIADANNASLFVGHVFLYSAGVAKMKEIVSGGELGEICYIASSRLNLGRVQSDVNVLWDLAPHDISIILELMGKSPVSVSCSGLAYLDPRIHEVCNLTLRFADNCIGIVHVSWLDPHKRRLMTVVGNKKMAVFDDVNPLEKIRIYDNGVEPAPATTNFGEFLYSYRYGEIRSPRIKEVEPLRVEARSFIDSILSGQPAKSDGWNGLRVVEIIEAADQSLREGGGHVTIPRTVIQTREPQSVPMVNGANNPTLAVAAAE
jgi:predicted dehydrogenase